MLDLGFWVCGAKLSCWLGLLLKFLDDPPPNEDEVDEDDEMDGEGEASVAEEGRLACAIDCKPADAMFTES